MLPHRILGIHPTASALEIRAAFKRRALESHPDKGGNAADFQKIMAAFEALSVGSSSSGLAEQGEPRQKRKASADGETSKQKISKPRCPRPPEHHRGDSACQTSQRRGKQHVTKTATAKQAPKPSQRSRRTSMSCYTSRQPSQHGQSSESAAAAVLAETLGCAIRIRGKLLLVLFCRNLQRLDVDRRRKLISEELSPGQRKILEEWMIFERKHMPNRDKQVKIGSALTLARRTSRSTSRDTQESEIESSCSEANLALCDREQIGQEGDCDSIGKSFALHVQDEDAELEMRGNIDNDLTGILAPVGTDNVPVEVGTCDENMQQPTSGPLVRGVIRIVETGKAVRYQAVSVLQMLRVFSRKTPDLGRCLEFHMVLTGVKQRMLAESTGDAKQCLLAESIGDDDGRFFEHRFLSAFNAALKDHAVTMEEMLPRCTTAIPARWWIGANLYTPYSDLQNGLKIWRLLHAARGPVLIGSPMAILNRVSPTELDMTWARLLDAYLYVWKTYGSPRKTLVNDATERSERSRLLALCSARASVRQDHIEKWNRCRMLQEEERQRSWESRQAQQERRLAAQEAKASQFETACIAREERRQRKAERMLARQEARERRDMRKADIEGRSFNKRNRIDEPLHVRVGRRISRLLSCWRAHDRRKALNEHYAAGKERAAALREQRRIEQSFAKQKVMLARVAREKARHLKRVRECRWRKMHRRDVTMADLLGAHEDAKSGDSR